MLADLVKHARRDDLGRDAFHAVGLVEVGVALVEVLVVLLQLLVADVVLLSALGHDVRLEVEERASVGLAGKGSLADEDVGDVLEDPLDVEKRRFKVLLDGRLALGLLAATLALLLPLASEGDPATEVIHEVEDGLRGTSESARYAADVDLYSPER